MALSVVQFLVLLGAAVAVPPSGRYFFEDPWSRKAVPDYREPVDVTCTQKIANTLKLAIVYHELSETIQPLYTILHDVYIEPELSDKVASMLSSASVLQPRYLLDTTYSHRVPILLWTMSELRPVFVERRPLAPRMWEVFSRKLTRDCSNLIAAHELTTLMTYLTKAESTFITEVKAMISRLPTTSPVTAHLMSQIDVVTSTMTWAHHLIMAEMTIPSQIITYWAESRHPLVESLRSWPEGSWESTEESWESWESNESWKSNEIPREDMISVHLPRPTEIRCYRQKLDMYKLLLLNSLVDMDSLALETLLKRTLSSPELTIRPDVLPLLRQQMPLTITKMLRTVHLKLADILMEPSVATIMYLARPKFEVLLNINVLRSLASEPTRLELALQSAVDAIMMSDKLCAVDPMLLNHNLTTIMTYLQNRMHISEIKAALNPVLSHYLSTFTMEKLFSAFESRFMPVWDLQKTLVRCLSSDLTTVRPRPETLLFRFSSLLAVTRVPNLLFAMEPAPKTDVLISSLTRVGVDPTTPFLMVPGPLLREVILDVATSLTPKSVPCARLAALKVAVAFSRTAITKELSYEERFIELFTERSLQSHISPEELKLIGVEVRKVLLGKIKNTFTDEGIEKAESILKGILSLEASTFEKPVPEVLTPMLEKMKTLLNSITCTENMADLREKTIVAMIHSLKTPLPTSEIETMVKKIIKNTAQETEVVALLTRVLPELTGGLLEEVELMRQYVEDLNIKHFPLILSDCVVRVMSEVSPIPIMREMSALFPRESPMAIVMQPRARRLTRHITSTLFKSLKTKGVKMTKEKLDSVVEAVVGKLNKLGFKSTEPSNESFKPKMSYAVAGPTMSALGDMLLEKASPSVIRHVISLAMSELEHAELRPECLNAARVKLMSGVLRVLLERHLLMSTPESGMFVTVYNLLRPEMHTLEDIHKVTTVLSSTLRTKVRQAMTGLNMFKDTERTEELVRELFKLPYERLSGLTLRELLAEPLSKIKTFYKDFTTCSFDMNTFTQELDTFSERWAEIKLTKVGLTQLLTPVLSDRPLLEKVCTKLETVALPEIGHHVATNLMYIKNSITAPSPAVFRRMFGRIIVSAFGLKSPVPFRGFLEHPLFDVFTTELHTELLYKLIDLKVERAEAMRLLNAAIMRSLEESTPTPWSLVLISSQRSDKL